jgi:hypothetical protein
LKEYILKDQISNEGMGEITKDAIQSKQVIKEQK